MTCKLMFQSVEPCIIVQAEDKVFMVPVIDSLSTHFTVSTGKKPFSILPISSVSHAHCLQLASFIMSKHPYGTVIIGHVIPDYYFSTGVNECMSSESNHGRTLELYSQRTALTSPREKRLEVLQIIRRHGPNTLVTASPLPVALEPLSTSLIRGHVLFFWSLHSVITND
jgi:hypothetical protein